MINDMLALEREIAELEMELGYAYKRNKCGRDGLVIEYELALREVRKRLERLHDVYHSSAPMEDVCCAIEDVLELLKTL